MVGFGYGRKSSVKIDCQAKLPDPKMLTPEDIMKAKSLEVPNQLGPAVGSQLDIVGMSQMFPNLVACPDGTMIDFKTGRVVVDPRRGCQPGEWARLKVISPPQSQLDIEIPNQTEFAPQSSARTSELNASDSERYWQAQAEAERTKTPEMSDAQKQLLADLEAGKVMKLSRLEPVDESIESKSKQSS